MTFEMAIRQGRVWFPIAALVRSLSEGEGKSVQSNAPVRPECMGNAPGMQANLR